MKTRAFFFGRLLLPTAALISFSSSAQAVAITWTPTSGINWSNIANWAGVAPAGNELTFGTGGSSTTAGTITNTVDASVSVNSLLFNNTGTATQTTSISSGQTLTVAGAIAGAFTVNNTTAGSSNVTITGAGTLAVTGGQTTTSFNVGSANAVASGTSQVLNMAGLANFSASVASFNIGNGQRGSGTVTLGTTNSITATTLLLGGNTTTGGSVSTLNLGQTNTINANTITSGSGRSSGNINFTSGLTNATVTIRGVAGGSTTANLNVGIGNLSASGVAQGTVDFSGGGTGSVDALFGTVNLGQSASGTGSGSATGTLGFGAGTISATTMTLGLGTSGTSTAVSNGVVNMNANAGTLTATTVNLGVQTNASATDGATGTWNQNGGTAAITTLNMGNRTATTATANVSSTYNLAGGTLKAQSITAGNNGTGTGTVTRTFNWTGGTIQNLSGQDLTIASTNALTLNLNGGSGQKFTVDASRNIYANAAIAGTGGFTKDGAGTLTLSGANTYSGGTAVNAGTLALGASNTLLSTGAVTVGGGTLSLGVYNNTVASVSLTSGSITGSGGILTSAGTYDARAGSVSAILAGNVGLTKSTSGALTLSGANTYSGSTAINGGSLTAGNSSALGSGALSIASGATLSSGSLGVGAITLEGGANIILNGVANQITSSGAVAISGTNNLLTVGGGFALAGNTYNLLTGTSLSATGISLTGSGVGGGTVALGESIDVGRNTYAFSATGTALQLSVTGGAWNLTWNGGNGNWNTSDAVGQKNGVGSNTAFVVGDNMSIATADTIAVDAGGITAGALAVSNNGGTATLNGGTLTASSLTKSGAGTLNLNTATNLAGAATISGGTLALGTGGSLVGATSVGVSGGTLNIGETNQSLSNVSLTNGASINGSTGVLTGTGSAFDMQSGSASAILAGSVGLNKTTSGTVTLSGANTYTGTTTISGGTLAFSADNNLGASAAAISLNGGTLAQGAADVTGTHVITVGASGGTIDVGSRQYWLNTANLLTGSGALTVKGSSGSLRLGLNNSFSGTTAVNSGALVEVQNATGLGTSSITVNSGGELVASNITMANAVTADGGSTLSFDNGNSGTFSGTITLSSGTTTVALRDWYSTGTARSGRISGAISGSGGLSINNGSGTGGVLTLSSANTYSGGTTLNSGTLALGNYTAAGTGSITAANGTTISLTSSGGVASNTVILSGVNANVTMTSNQASAGYLTNISGTADQTLVIVNNGNAVNFNSTTKQFANFAGTVNVQAGSSLVDRSSATTWTNGGDGTLFNVSGFISSRNGGTWALGGLTGSGTLGMGTAGSNNIGLNYTIGARNDASNTFSGVIQNGDTATGKIVSVTKVGTGTQVFSGINTYSGLTSVTAGTLALGAAGSIDNTSGVYLGTGDGTFDVSAKEGGYTVARLTGSGNVIGALAVSTQLAIGNSPGTADFSSDLTLGAGSTYTYELVGGTAGLNSADLGNVVGNLVIEAGATLDLLQLGTYTAYDKFTLFSYSGTLSGAFSGLANNSTFTGAGGDWLINYYDTSAGTNGGTQSNFVTITAVPEPNAAMLVGGLGVLALLRRRRA